MRGTGKKASILKKQVNKKMNTLRNGLAMQMSQSSSEDKSFIFFQATLIQKFDGLTNKKKGKWQDFTDEVGILESLDVEDLCGGAFGKKVK